VHEKLLAMPAARALDGLPVATRQATTQASLEGFTLDGYRNADGSVGTRNLLAIATTVQCVAGVVDVALRRIDAELLPQYPNVDGVVALHHAYGCLMLDVASGHRTWAERHRLHNALVLFNPAPVT
jgi:galactarate dehydratase